jgi:uncharacterized membrane protein
MVNYDIILNIISIVLLFIILFIILFGCRGKRYRERFTNNNEKEEKEQSKKPTLSPFENNILEKLSNGSLSTEAFTNLIKEEKFTKDNLNNVINYVEHNKGVMTTSD